VWILNLHNGAFKSPDALLLETFTNIPFIPKSQLQQHAIKTLKILPISQAQLKINNQIWNQFLYSPCHNQTKQLTPKSTCTPTKQLQISFLPEYIFQMT